VHLGNYTTFLNGTKPHVANLMDVRQTPCPRWFAPLGEDPLPSGRGPSALPLAGFPFSVRGIVTLRPSRLDVAISKRCARAATPARGRSLRIMTWLADEKILLGPVGLFWLNARLRSHDEDIIATLHAERAQ